MLPPRQYFGETSMMWRVASLADCITRVDHCLCTGIHLPPAALPVASLGTPRKATKSSCAMPPTLALAVQGKVRVYLWLRVGRLHSLTPRYACRQRRHALWQQQRRSTLQRPLWCSHAGLCLGCHSPGRATGGLAASLTSLLCGSAPWLLVCRSTSASRL